MKVYAKRLMSLMLTFALVIAIPFAFTQEASAASKKTQYVPTTVTTISKDENGADVSSVTSYEYYKNGLTKAVTYQDGSKRTYTRNKKGYVTARYSYDKNGQLEDFYTFTYKYNKKGLPVQTNEFDKTGKLVGTTVSTFFKNGKTKKEIYTSAEGTYVSTCTYNKKGDITSYLDQGNGFSYSGVFTYKYDKKGNPVYEVDKYVSTDEEGTYSNERTTTYSYKYDKKKNIKSAVVTEVYNSGTYSSTSTYTSTYTYKKVKVAKKFQKFFR